MRYINSEKLRVKLFSIVKTIGYVPLYALSILFIQSCTQSLDGGSIEKTFNGIASTTVLGPETVEITWVTSPKCNNYGIYLLSSNAGSSVATAALSPIRLQSPTVVDAQAYTFAVGCNSSSGVTGQDVTLSATTWSKFNGVITSSIDTTGQNPILVLDWSYLQNSGTVFEVFAKESIVPGDLVSPNPWQLTRTGPVGTEYSETPICSTYAQQVRIGTGGNCQTNALKPGVTYNFKVVAKYPDGKYSNDIAGNGTTQAVPAAFTPPTCILTQSGIGSDAQSSYLFLRCGSSSGGSCPLVSVRAYQVNDGSRNIVSDTMTGAGTLRIQPSVSPTADNSRIVQGLEVDYTCLSTNPTTIATVRYDDSDAQHKKPYMKYGNDGYEAASLISYAAGQHPSNVGLVTAVGDFNCDGKPDIAIGLPNITFNSAPYYNKNPGSGAVKVIYDYVQNANGTFSGASEQYLTFRDLPAYAGFGRSLSVGNINKDIYADFSTASYFSCDDLIIGAPGVNGVGLAGGSNSSNFTGAAYIFYGQPQKFPQPFDSSGLALNAATCTGTITNEVCSPVRLSPDTTTWLKTDPSWTSESTARNKAPGLLPYVSGTGAYAAFSSFGFQVSYIRDFNADGYGDIAISDPYCDWDGETTNGKSAPAIRQTIRQVGCVYVYWGGPSGIGNVNMGTTPDGLFPLVSPFAKIYPPFPEQAMHFGWSLSGGGDVDSKPPVPVKRNGGQNIILANGNDFIVGAPDFIYKPFYQQWSSYMMDATADGAEGKITNTNWLVSDPAAGKGSCQTTNSCPVDPQVNRGPNLFNAQDPKESPKVVTPRDGAWMGDPTAWDTKTGPPWANSGTQAGKQPGLAASTGIAFLYLGRSPVEGYGIAVDDGFAKYPNQVSSTLPAIGADAIEGLLSSSMRDRTNGSQTLRVSTAPYDWRIDPVDSFYNCGSRGSPLGNSLNGAAGGYYKHVSCLAGRNNFSVIYPALKTSDAAVVRFGSKVKIAGANDQNAIALYELGSAVGTSSGFSSSYTRVGDDLMPLAQGSLHDRIRGTNLWELGIKGLSAPTVPDALETYANALTPNNICSSGNCAAYQGILSRSAINETYNFPTIFTGVANPAKPLTDINQDGYADVVVGSDSGKVFTYYGNFAADFNYQGNNNTTAPNCAVTRLTSIVCGSANFGSALPGCLALAGSGNNSGIKPFTTYRGYASAINAPTVSGISSQYPEAYIPASGYYATLATLEDVGDTSAAGSISYNYKPITLNGAGVRNSSTIVGTPSYVAQSCLPLVKSYASAVTSISAGDLNNDGIIDVVLGFSADSGNIGKTIVSSGGTNGIGLSFDTAYTVSSASAKNGSSVVATNWMFMDGSSRRDLFSGASGYNGGSGAIYDYTASNMATLSTTPAAPILVDVNFPNNLKAERSKVIGDVNGDGYDDILMPVRQVSSSGSVYYNAMIFFGSSLGPVTYSFCMNKLASIKNSAGVAISSSDCLGTAGSAIATINGTPIRLPQYITSPTGVSSIWILSAFEAGDVDHDGNSDLLIMDYASSSMYLFFGSSSGIVNGTPHTGPMVNHAPQLVIQNPLFMNYYYSVNGAYLPISSWNYGNLSTGSGAGYSLQSYPITHGDFNGDGYQDLAFTFYTYPPGHDTPWDCTPGQIADPLMGMCYNDGMTHLGPYNWSPSGYGPTVMVIYGGITGYQTPVNGSQTPVPFDSDVTMSVCPNFYNPVNYVGASACLYASTGTNSLNYFREAYDTLSVDGNGFWNVNTTRTACDPTSNLCKGELIRNPAFYKVNSPSDGGYWLTMEGYYNGFGTMLTVADANHDGIDDLMVSGTLYSLPGFNTTDMPGNTVVTGNANSQGRVFIFYGAKGAGLVAPNASMMVGDKALGLDTINNPGNSIYAANTPPFAIYPITADKLSVNQANWPELEISETLAQGALRSFGLSTSAGDFNGDGFDDIAVVSASGQTYIYYGPICQFDNEKATWGTTYNSQYHNKGTLVPSGTILQGECSTFNFNIALASNNSLNPIGVSDAPTKPMYPQMIYVSGTTKLNGFGSMLMSKRPIRSTASNTIIKNPGNIDNDPEKTSDLVIGTNTLQDPNVTSPLGSNTGLAYVFFGHKDYGVGEMPTTPGLFITNASYNSALLTKNLPASRCNSECFYHQPIIVKAHTSDGVIGQFYYYESSMGDFNGDGSGDLLLPTDDIHYGDDVNKTPVVNGGGFKLIY